MITIRRIQVFIHEQIISLNVTLSGHGWKLKLWMHLFMLPCSLRIFWYHGSAFQWERQNDLSLSMIHSLPKWSNSSSIYSFLEYMEHTYLTLYIREKFLSRVKFCKNMEQQALYKYMSLKNVSVLQEKDHLSIVLII